MDETDNENEMVIDTSTNSKTNFKSKVRVRKRKRISSSSTDEYVLPDNTLEVEKNLQASALKNNLDPASVKKIIKKVVTNDHVLAFVKLREEEEGSSTDEDVPTLTRSKAKTVKKVPRVTAPWNLQLDPIEHIPVKTRPEVEALIAQELPEDEDDEEYEPTNDDIPSDDDHILESCSDLDSQPRTPATPRNQIDASPKVARDGPFKVPQEVSGASRRPMEEEATIALRTRSKLSLSATPIEHIESSFVPPDEPPACDVDEVWSAFLQECLGPAPAVRPDDDDDDPEYNVAADPDAHEDEEGLENSLIKISKKELEDILTELCQVIPGQPTEAVNGVVPQTTQDEVVDVPLHWEGKQEPISDGEQKQPVVAAKIQQRQSSARLSIGKTEPLDDHEVQEPTCTQDVQTPQESSPLVICGSCPRDVTLAVEEVRLVGGAGAARAAGEGAPAVVRLVTSATAPVVHVDVDDNVKFLPEQLLLLQQQLRQHVQLAASSFLQLCVHPVHWARAPSYREYLESLHGIATSRPGSLVDVCNLRPAVELINAYERSVTEVTPENEKMVEFIAEEMEKMQNSTTHKYVYRGNFPETFRRVVANSSVFVYPHLLPPSPFRPKPCARRFSYLRSEDELIALGLDQFRSYVEANPGLFSSRGGAGRRRGLHAAAALVSKHMMPWIPTKTLTSHIAVVRKSGDQNNPINKFLKNRTVEPVRHKLLPFNPKLTLYEQPEYEMPRSWVSYLAKSSKRFRSYLYRRTHITGPPPSGVELDFGGKLETPPKRPLPIDFTETYTCNRTSNGASKPSEKNVTQAYTSLQIDSTLFNVVSVNDGVLLVPVSHTNTVNMNNAPIPAPVEVKPRTITVDSGNIDKGKDTLVKIMSKPEVSKDTDSKKPTNEEPHCECCVLFRKICRVRQTYMTEYIRNSKFKKRTCPCSDIKYPRVSNKLKLLLKYYWTFSKTMYNKVKKTLEDLSADVDSKDDVEAKNEEKDVVFVISFLIKLMIRMNMTRTLHSKKRIDEILSNFDVLTGNPLYLAADLRGLLGASDIDLYREFMGFLTAEQADRLEKFREYFIVNCMDDLLKKIEEQIPERARRRSVSQRLRQAFVEGARACELCCELLLELTDYPALAAHTFRLFPHRQTKKNTVITDKNIEEDVNITDCDIEKNENVHVCNAQQDQHDTSCDIQDVKKDVEKTESPVDVLKPVVKDQAMDSDDEEENTSSSNEKGAGSVSGDDRDPFDGELTICEDTNADYEEDSRDKGKDMDVDTNDTRLKEEPIDTYEITITDTEVQSKSNMSNGHMQCLSEDSKTSIRIVLEEETIKSESPEWRREEDKLILEIIKQSLTQEDLKNKTINEVMDAKSEMLSECFVSKSISDIKERVVHLLQFVSSSK